MLKNRRGRRLSGAHITLIVVAACTALAPTAAYAADRVVSVIGDPYNSSALVRVSEDGRLGVRGEALVQQGLPTNEWHKATGTLPDHAVLLHEAPPGAGIGLSQITGHWNRRGMHMSMEVGWTASDGPCERSIPALTWARTTLYTLAEAFGPDRPVGTKQAVFPVPITIPPSPDKHLCLYTWGFVWTSEGRREMTVSANGISGSSTPVFTPAKGQPATTPGDDPDGKNQP